jgi:hypothetical protein
VNRHKEKLMRHRSIVALVLAAALSALAVSSASAGGLTPAQLQEHGWTCIVPPPFPDQIACFDPGRGRPFPGNPDPAPSYDSKVFNRATGEFLWTVTLIRDDLYHGQPCGSRSESYRFIPLIGYWECIHN